MNVILGFCMALLAVATMIAMGLCLLMPIFIIMAFVPPSLLGASLIFGYLFLLLVIALTPMFME